MQHSLQAALVMLASTVLLSSSCAKSDHRLSVTVAGGEGRILSSSGPAIDCRDSCSVTLPANTHIELTASPDALSKFQGWGGDCNGMAPCQLTLSEDRTVTATFAPITYSLHVQLEGAEGGAVLLPDGSLCTNSCEVEFGAGRHVQLVAAPREDTYLIGWSGACSGEHPACDIDAATDSAVTAQFGRKDRVDITGITEATKGLVTSAPTGIRCGDANGQHQSACSMWLTPGSQLELTAKATDEMWRFRSWSGADCTESSCDVTVEHDLSITATFSSLHAWSRTLSHTADGWAVAAGKNDGVVVALINPEGQDFGDGIVYPKQYPFGNLYVAGYASSGIPSFTSVFGGSAEPTGVTLLSRANGSVSVETPLKGDPGASIELGGYQAIVPAGKVTSAWLDLDAAGAVTAAGGPSASTEFEVVRVSGSTTFAVANFARDLIGVLRPDWTFAWSIQGGRWEELAPAPSDAIWVLAAYLQPQQCAGASPTGAALVHVDSSGDCRATWVFPASVIVTAITAPGGAPLLVAEYSQSFEFAGQPLPQPPAGGRYCAFLRFDAQGQPRWFHLPSDRDIASGNVDVADAVALADGELLMTGWHQGYTEINGTLPATAGTAYIATWSDDSGEMTWSHSLRPPKVTDTSVLTPVGLVPLADGRVALWGGLTGSFDLGGGPLAVTPGHPTGFVAVYDF